MRVDLTRALHKIWFRYGNNQQKESKRLLRLHRLGRAPRARRLLNAIFVVLFYLAFAYWRAPWWVLVCMGFTFSFSIAGNINSVCHNFVHTPFSVPRCSTGSSA